MKLNLKIAVAALCAALAAFGALGCVDQTVTTLGTEAVLTSLTIGSVRAGTLPAPISSSVWNQDNRSLYNEPIGNLQFNRAGDITQARIRPGTSRGARAEWCIGSRTFCADEFLDTRVPASFESDEYLYIKVTSEDLAVVNYYRFYTRVYSWVTDLASVTINERETKPAKGADSYDALIGGNVPADMIGELYITRGEAKDTVITPNPFDPNSTVRFAKTKSTATPAFVSASTPISFDDEDWLFVEVTAENTVDKTFFKYRVWVGRMTTIASLKFKGSSKGDMELFGMGLPAQVWRNVASGEYALARADQPAGGFDIDITLDDPEAAVDYQIYAESSLPGPTGLNANSPMNNTKHTFGSKDYLVIRVKSLNGGITNFYRIQVTLLAANILEHPKSTWYYSDYTTGDYASPVNKRPVEPLTVVLDGQGSYSYQWYTADSLFGIYGRHGMSIDEKNNISTINGGPDMYYYLGQPGINQYGNPASSYVDEKSLTELAWKIEGETGPSYTPRNDWKDVPVKYRPGSAQNSTYPYDPADSLYYTGATDLEEPEGGWPIPAPNHVNFFTGATCEVRYYWVVVTDNATGLTVTSDRAVILTETEPRMKHYIFDLSKLPRRKNLKPFTFLRELDKIEIPNGYFGQDFDDNTSNYALCTAQAQYYLPDGRPWTQNWTHGDLHFGYNEGSPKGPLTWWHNNLGANAGAIPLQTPHSAQGGLTQPPDWVGFAPSGDKGRGLPPVDSNGKLPVGYKPSGFAEGAAQGYFCGFIELMELRFSSPPP